MGTDVPVSGVTGDCQLQKAIWNNYSAWVNLKKTKKCKNLDISEKFPLTLEVKVRCSASDPRYRRLIIGSYEKHLSPCS